MATIVKIRGSQKHLVLLGVGFGMYRTSKPNAIFGNLIAEETEGESRVVATTDESGEVHWYHSKDLVVVSVDGVSPREALAEFQ